MSLNNTHTNKKMNSQVQITYGDFQGTGEGGDMEEGDQKVQASNYEITKSL